MITKEMYNNFFGSKTSLTKEDRAYINKKSKLELIREATNLGLMVDDKLTKPEIFNLIKKYKKEQLQSKVQQKLNTDFNMSSLLDTLPQLEQKHLDYTKLRESNVLDYNVTNPRRFPPGSKIIRKEDGLSKQQKTVLRREIKNEIDYLSELLKNM
jgi:hypothetical protein